jgi:hypothetical protein
MRDHDHLFGATRGEEVALCAQLVAGEWNAEAGDTLPTHLFRKGRVGGLRTGWQQGQAGCSDEQKTSDDRTIPETRGRVSQALSSRDSIRNKGDGSSESCPQLNLAVI